MMVIGMIGCFIAIGFARWNHRPAPSDLVWKVLINGAVGYGIGALVGLLLYRFKEWRLSPSSSELDSKRDDTTSPKSDRDDNSPS